MISCCTKRNLTESQTIALNCYRFRKSHTLMELGVSVAVAQCLTTTHDTIGISFQLNVQLQTAITRKVFGFRPSVALAKKPKHVFSLSGTAVHLNTKLRSALVKKTQSDQSRPIGYFFVTSVDFSHG